MGIPLIDPGDSSWYTLDWSDDLAPTVTLSSVVHSLPSPLSKTGESNTTSTSSVKISGAVHAQLYMVEGQATLSTGEVINRQFPLRAFNG